MNDLPWAKKSLGQHWLTDRASLESIADAAEVAAGDQVLEIGPGTGSLTEVLLEKGAEVLALEFDQDAIEPLHKKFAKTWDNQLQIQEGDIRTFDLSSLPDSYKVVANIPYYLTANLFRKLIDSQHKPATAVLLVQKEVAERAAAEPGKLSFVAVALQLFYEVEPGELVLAHLFTPPPKVDSQILILRRRPQPLFPGIDSNRFFRLVKAGFSQRRKKLKSALKSGLDKGIDPGDLLLRARISPDARAQELSLEQWHQLYLALP